MPNNSITDQSYWDDVYGKSTRLIFDRSKILFTDLFSKYVNRGSECFEVGCFPGKYLIYLATEFDCKVAGIDYTSEFPRMITLLKEHGVDSKSLYNQDFLNFESVRKYDFVFSLGFIEHFRNYDVVIRKHIDLVRPGGVLLLTCPNFRGLQWLLHYLLDRDNLTAHNISAMNLRSWHSILKTNGMTLLQHRHYGTFRFWVAQQPDKRYKRWLVKRLMTISRSRAIHQVNFPLPFSAPFIISVSIKENHST